MGDFKRSIEPGHELRNATILGLHVLSSMVGSSEENTVTDVEGGVRGMVLVSVVCLTNFGHSKQIFGVQEIIR